ncbi:SDR family oxidoreductase [Vibrio sp. SG41-7]|uniref:SDR family NAD(P)-dependent oxidoreductase n=1 Tax=Vibrio sp. SG41-7 TaxID=2760973 RepID=UPI00160205B3|nr:SDR family oxidoreductase [Vibrio sp. SG41-7]MBB1466734.1 SDR family oxidoreductase [Vibrio sp. SG41-7]
MLLKNKVVIITGAASGIGLATVKLFLEEGAQVIAGDINKSDEILEVCKSNKSCYFLKSDVTKVDDHINLIEFAIEKFGVVNICFNNAGIVGDTSSPGAEQSITLFDKVYEINVKGVALAMNTQIDYFMKNKVSSPSIINTASIAGKIAVKNSAPYIMSKHAVVGLTKAYAVDYASKGIRINMVAPGVISTPLVNRDADPDLVEKVINAHPIGRVGQPEEISELVLFLASDRSTFINGAYYNIDGGYLAV